MLAKPQEVTKGIPRKLAAAGAEILEVGRAQPHGKRQ